MSKERPILFSGEMVRAILDGQKKQTRRIVKPQPYQSEYEPSLLSFAEQTKRRIVHQDGSVTPKGALSYVTTTPEGLASRCPYGTPGQQMWVRETWRPIEGQTGQIIEADYRATPEARLGDLIGSGTKWKPSIHMPRWASRITLEITNVRVERLQSISPSDAIAEGVDYERHGEGLGNPCDEIRAMDAFTSLWQSINGPNSWDENPFVWVITFKRINEQQSAA